MRRRARWLVARFSLGLWAAAASAQAFCVTHTCDRNDPKQACECNPAPSVPCTPTSTMSCTPACTGSASECVVSGLALYWAHNCVSFDVEQDGSPLRGISYDQLHTIVVGAAAAWTSVDCGGGARPSIFLNDYGPAACNHPEYNKSHPNANVIMFHDATPWPYMNQGAETLALTTVTFDTTTGEIFDADIEINSADNRFVLDPNAGSPAGPTDLPGVITHEMGHFLGLSHSDNNVATMFSVYQTGMSSLEQDDVDGICAAMGNGQRNLANDCTPRHGFSKDCASADSGGCCSTAVGASASRAQALGLLAFGLGLLGWRARRRNRRLGP